jgi:hypothetical protein
MASYCIHISVSDIPQPCAACVDGGSYCIKVTGHGTSCYACRIRHKTCHVNSTNPRFHWIKLNTDDPNTTDPVAQRQMELDEAARKQIHKHTTYMKKMTRTVVQQIEVDQDEDVNMNKDMMPCPPWDVTPPRPACSPSPRATSASVTHPPFQMQKMLDAYQRFTREHGQKPTSQELLSFLPSNV